MKYTWFLLDADGTLFDYAAAEVTALETTFAQIGHPFEPHYAAMYSQINERIWREFELERISSVRLRTKRFEQLFEAINIDADPMSFSEQYLRNLAECGQLLDGAEDVVRQLAQKVKLFLITNGLTDVQRSRFAHSSIKDYFTGMVTSEEARAAKPDGRIFDEAFLRMGAPEKREVFMVGDSLTSDMRGGCDYGLATCWYNPGHLPRDPSLDIRYEITDLRELVGITETV
jgi:2-haloacid dehalogenase